MKGLFVDCPTGLAGDMILGGLLDLGVPLDVIEKPIASFGLENSYKIRIEESSSYGFRGLKVHVDSLEIEPRTRFWKEIREKIIAAKISETLKDKIYRVFKSLAEAESFVHGQPIDTIHFHEIGAIDSLVDIVGVCAAIDYINPDEIICAVPSVGRGTVETLHGILPVPAPAVLEIANKYRLELLFGEDCPHGELTTPTGLALMAVMANRFARPLNIAVRATGVGLGHRSLDRPNILRICEFTNGQSKSPSLSDSNPGIFWQSLVSQEAWIDDATPEDISAFTTELRQAGAIDVVCQQVQMKKGRQGISLSALVSPEKASELRQLWLEKGFTFGLRERFEGRWVLPRRSGFVPSKWGPVKAKQIIRPSGSKYIKLEHDDLLRISLDSGNSLSEVRREVSFSLKDFSAEQDWTC